MRIANGKGSCGIINLPNDVRVNAQRIKNSAIQPITLSAGILSYQQTQWQVIPHQPVMGLEGLSLSNNVVLPATALNVSAGYAWVTIGSPQLAYLPSTLTKYLNATWTSGTGQGGRFNTTLAGTPGTYHVFLIKNNSTGQVDVGFDVSVVAANRPSGWSARRLGSILWTGTTIRPFIQHGWMFEHNPPVVDFTATYINIVPTLYSLTVPTGLVVKAYGVFAPGLAANGFNLRFSIQSPNQTSLTPVDNPTVSSFRGNASCYLNSVGEDLVVLTTSSALTIPTNSAGQIQLIRAGDYNAPDRTSSWLTHGWIDDQLLTGY